MWEQRTVYDTEVVILIRRLVGPRRPEASTRRVDKYSFKLRGQRTELVAPNSKPCTAHSAEFVLQVRLTRDKPWLALNLERNIFQLDACAEAELKQPVLVTRGQESIDRVARH